MHTLHVGIFSTLPSHPCDIAVVYFTYLYMVITQHNVTFIILNQHLAFKSTKNTENKRFCLHFIFLWSSTFFVFVFACVCVCLCLCISDPYQLPLPAELLLTFLAGQVCWKHVPSIFLFFICPRKSLFLLHFGRMLFLDIEF